MTVSSEMLVGVAGVVLSLLFSYIPGLRTWYGALVAETKQLIMLGLIVVVSGVIFALGCYDILSVGVTCDRYGVISLVWMVVLGITSNQAAFMITPEATDVKEVKALRDIQLGDCGQG